MKRNLAIALVALAAILVGAGLWFFAADRKPVVAAAPVPAAVPVVTAAVIGKDVPIYLRGIGTVIAYNTDVVRSQIQGQIELAPVVWTAPRWI
ncbi:multidrug efflux pump subunit AcrA (membrane-fusion protein) [Bradyrhizobium japonicum]